ncbi:U-scoloptoxin(16)-Er12a-like [Parasteatoda tepidariorum]|uniref:U-scoloptoxin(16)-Er12a-like n=1 Tax=Parasteatoda tepidariorum TaxID=114398 RepID=UPI0039BD46A4
MIRSVFCLFLTISFIVMVTSGPPTPVPPTLKTNCGEHKNGETFHTEHPCMVQTCTMGILSGKGCPSFALPKDSKCRGGTGKGAYPHCCEHPVCPGDPGF